MTGKLVRGFESLFLRHLLSVAVAAAAAKVMMTSVELFAGVGGLALGVSTRYRHFGAGVPCQPWSLGGKHQGFQDERNLFPDTVGAIRTLRPKVVLIENVKGLLRQSFARYFEYITLMIRHPEVTRKHTETWMDHLVRLERCHTSGQNSGLEYKVLFQLVNAADYGVPQRRQRVFIVGFRSDVGMG